MAGSISESFDNLSAQINSLAADFRALGIGVRGRTRLESSSEFKKAIALVRNNTFLTQAYNIQNKAKDIQRAQRAMRSHPNRWKTPDEYLTWEKEQKERRDKLSERERELRKERFDRQQRLSDKILSIRSPERYRKMMLSREYGDVGANQIIAAEQDKEQQERRDKLAQRERELRKERFDRQQEVSDKIMSIKSPDRYRKMMLSRKYGTSNADAIIAAEDAEEQRLRDSRRSISVRRYQVDTYKRFPWIKTLVDAGIIQKKELPRISKDLRRMSKAPVIGKILRHPSLIPLTAYAATVQGLKMSDEANKGIVGWENAFNYYGKPSKEFVTTAYKAGIYDPAKIAEIYGKLKLKYLDPEKFLSGIGGKIKGMNDTERLFVANQLGLSPQTLAMADMMSGRLKPNEARMTAAGKEIIGTVKQYGLSTGSGFSGTAESAWLMIPGMESAAARDYSNLDYVRKGFDESLFKALNMAEEAAESSEKYDREKPASKYDSNSPEVSTGNQVTMNVNEIRILDAKDVQGLIRSIESEAGMGYNIDVMNWADSRRVKV